MNILFALAALHVSRGDAEFRKENYIKSSHLSHHRVHSLMYLPNKETRKTSYFLNGSAIKGGGWV